MRETRKTQSSLRENWLDLDHADELQTISRLLDDHPRIDELVLQDLRTMSDSPQATLGRRDRAPCPPVIAGESPGVSWGKVQRDVRDRLAKR